MSGIGFESRSGGLKNLTARLTGEDARAVGTCKKCGFAGHLAFQCRLVTDLRVPTTNQQPVHLQGARRHSFARVPLVVRWGHGGRACDGMSLAKVVMVRLRAGQ